MIDSDGTFSSKVVEMEKAEEDYIIATMPNGGEVRPTFINCCYPLKKGNTDGVVIGEFSEDLGRIGGTFRTQSNFPNGTVGQYIGAFVADENR